MLISAVADTLNDEASAATSIKDTEVVVTSHIIDPAETSDEELSNALATFYSQDEILGDVTNVTELEPVSLDHENCNEEKGPSSGEESNDGRFMLIQSCRNQ